MSVPYWPGGDTPKKSIKKKGGKKSTKKPEGKLSGGAKGKTTTTAVPYWPGTGTTTRRTK
jgi:hypothetical protein